MLKRFKKPQNESGAIGGWSERNQKIVSERRAKRLWLLFWGMVMVLLFWFCIFYLVTR